MLLHLSACVVGGTNTGNYSTVTPAVSPSSPSSPSPPPSPPPAPVSNPPAPSSTPSLAITVPTGTGNFSATTASITVSGTASDSAAISTIAWSNDRGGTGSQSFNAASVNWNFSNVPLLTG